jgi:hypothetical protein
VKTSGYFKFTRQRKDRSWIRFEWIERVIKNPARRTVQADGRIRTWAPISEAHGQYLRFILLDDGETVHNAFFDRDFRR